MGYGDGEARGDQSDEMGDFLDVVQLPTGFLVEQLVVYSSSNCVASTEAELVCFGWNTYGQLFAGSSSSIGDGADEMGDNLVPLDLGEDFTLAQLGGGHQSRCAVSTAGGLKWFGVSYTLCYPCSVILFSFFCCSQLGTQQ